MMTLHPITRLACAILVVAAISGCESRSAGMAGSQANEDVITVFAAASTTNAVEEIREAFIRTTGIHVQTNYAASSTLAQQIIHGAEADVFISANVGWADRVEKGATSLRRRNLLGNRLVIIVPSDSRLALETPEALVQEDLEHLALGDTDSVPAGKYAKEALTKLGLWDRLESKVVPGKDVRHALMYVETGAAEAGIVYATDAVVSKKVKVVAEISADLTEPVVYPVLLLKGRTKTAVAAEFYDYLGSPEATRIFKKFGFDVIP